MISVIISLTGCTKEQEKMTYFSVVESFYETPESTALKIHTVNPKDGTAEEVGKVIPHGAQYPLAVYEKNYSVRICTDDSYGDQLFCYDVASEKTTQLTQDIYAVNYILPAGDFVYMLGAMMDTHYLTILKYDIKTKELCVFDTEGKWNFQLLVYSAYNDKFYAYACLVEEEDAIYEAVNSSEEDEKLIPPDYRIFEVGDDFYNPKEILHTDRKIIRRMTPTSDSELFVTLAGLLPVDDPEYESYYLTIGSEALRDAPNIDSELYVSEFAYSVPGINKLYFIATELEKDTRGLYSYDLDSGEYQQIYAKENLDNYINGVFLLPE